MTFAEYKKSIQEKRKAIEALKTEERKVTVENQFEGMHLTGKKKEDDLQVNMQKSGKNKDKKDGFEKEKIVCKVCLFTIIFNFFRYEILFYAIY